MLAGLAAKSGGSLPSWRYCQMLWMGEVRRRVSMHGKMRETLRETIEKAYDEACNYYQLFKDESDRGAAVLAVARFKEQ